MQGGGRGGNGRKRTLFDHDRRLPAGDRVKQPLPIVRTGRAPSGWDEIWKYVRIKDK